MKKRVKLFTTIASLALAVALMAFGVYAATTVAVSVTNQVAFTATPNVKAQLWHTTSLTNATYDTSTGHAAPLADSEYDEDATPESMTCDVLFTGLSTDSTGTIALGNTVHLIAESGANEQMTYVYNIYIHNSARQNDSFPDLEIKITPVNVAYSAANGYGVVTTYWDNATPTNAAIQMTAGTGDDAGKQITTIGYGEEMHYTVTMTIDNDHTVAPVDLGTTIALRAYNAAN